MPTVKAGNRICQPITQANCRRDSRTGSRSMVGPLSPPATRRTNAPYPCDRGYTDAATEASPLGVRRRALRGKLDPLAAGRCRRAIFSFGLAATAAQERTSTIGCHSRRAHRMRICLCPLLALSGHREAPITLSAFGVIADIQQQLQPIGLN